MKAELSRLPAGVLLPTLLLLLIGLVAISSADPSGSGRLAIDQVKWMCVGTLAFGLAVIVPYRLLGRWSIPLYVLHLGLIASVAVFGVVRNNSRRWLDLKFMLFQPSLTMKIALVMVVAKCISTNRSLRRPSGLVVPLLLAAIPAAMVKLQPDLGTALTLIPVPLVLLFAGGARKRDLGALIAVGILALPILWSFAMDDYQKERVRALIFPEQHKDTTAYQTVHSIWAFAGGGVTGMGWGEGTQTHLRWLPEAHTDFIFSVIGEEWGLVGTLATVALYCALLLSMLEIADKTRDPFGRLLVLGIATVIFVHVFQNCSMVLGLMPVTGLTLPLVSYGGSSLVNMLAGLGLVVNVAIRPLPVFASSVV